jgi:hypothetical protein
MYPCATLEKLQRLAVITIQVKNILGTMYLKDLDYLELPASADMHVHLRHGQLMDLIVPQIRRGGVHTVFVCCVCV